MANELAPIVLFVYNRPLHTQRTIEALKKNILAKESILYIFSDAPKSNFNDDINVKKVRHNISTINGFKDIFIYERQRHLGLANSVISGVTEIIKKEGKVIVFEDDLISSPNFLQFMNNCLNFYFNNDKIFSISGYSFPIEIPEYYKEDIYLLPRSSSWGWATWLNRWNKVDWELNDYHIFIKSKGKIKLFNRGGDDLTDMLISQKRNKIDSWAIRWCYAHFKNNSYCLYPRLSKIQNIGVDKSGTHLKSTEKYLTNVDDGFSETKMVHDININEDIISNLSSFYKRGIVKKFVRNIRLFFNI